MKILKKSSIRVKIWPINFKDILTRRWCKKLLVLDKSKKVHFSSNCCLTWQVRCLEDLLHIVTTSSWLRISLSFFFVIICRISQEFWTIEKEKDIGVRTTYASSDALQIRWKTINHTMHVRYRKLGIRVLFDSLRFSNKDKKRRNPTPNESFSRDAAEKNIMLKKNSNLCLVQF